MASMSSPASRAATRSACSTPTGSSAGSLAPPSSGTGSPSRTGIDSPWRTRRIVAAPGGAANLSCRCSATVVGHERAADGVAGALEGLVSDVEDVRDLARRAAVAGMGEQERRYLEVVVDRVGAGLQAPDDADRARRRAPAGRLPRTRGRAGVVEHQRQHLEQRDLRAQ